MRKISRTKIKKITSLILSASLILSMNTVALADYDDVEVSNFVVEDNVEAEETLEQVDLVEEKNEEISTVVVETSVEAVEDAQEKDTAETKEATNGVEPEEALLGDSEYIEVSAKFGDFLRYYYEYNIDDDPDTPLIGFNYEPTEGGGNDYNYCHPLKTSIESAKSLKIDTSNSNMAEKVAFNSVADWSYLRYFTGLTTLYINGVSGISNIEFPSSLTSLTINNCSFNCIPDLSGCANLTSLTFTNNTGNGLSGDFSIKGLNAGAVNTSGDGSSTLTKLQTARFDRSSLKYIYFPDTDVQGDGELTFTAVNCTELVDVNTGGYKLINGFNGSTQYAPSFKGCSNLQSITIKGIANLATQALNIEECIRLVRPNISYYFDDAANVLEVKASGINLSQGDEPSFVRLAGSAAGKYKIDGFDGTYLTAYANDNSELFVGGNTRSSSVKYIVPEQDYEKFKENEVWKDGDSKKRDYSANPIVLRVQQRKDDGSAYQDVVENNTMHFFTEDGIELADCSATASIIVEDKPTDDELRAAGFSADEISKYQVVSVSNNSLNTITALNPGKAEISFAVNNGTGSMSMNQVVIVENPLVSATIDSVSTDGNNDYFASAGDCTFSATINTQYPSLVRYSAANVWWSLYKKTGDNEYAKYENASGDGLNIYSNASDKSIGSDNKIHTTYKFTVDKKSSGGELAIGGEIGSNLDSSGKIIDIAPSGYPITVVNMGTNLHSASKDPAHSEDFYLAYQASQADDGCINNSNARSVSQIDFSLPAITSDDYQVVGPEIVNTETITYTDYLKVAAAGEGDGCKKYKLVFRDDKTSDEIGTFLRSLSDDTRKVTVKAYVKKKDRDDYKTVTEFSETIKIVGRFTITYDYDDGSIGDDKINSTEYYVPSSISQAYSDKFVLTEEPTKTGYDFDGWECNGKSFTGITDEMVGNITVKAKWKGHEYTNTLKYDANLSEELLKELNVSTPEEGKGTATYPNTKCSIKVDDSISIDDGSTIIFAGWYTEKTPIADPTLDTSETDPRKVGDTVEVGDDNVADNQSRTLYAHWEYAKPIVSVASIDFNESTIGLNFYISNMQNYFSDNVNGTAYISFNGEEYRVDEGTHQGSEFVIGDMKYTAHINARNIPDEVVVRVYRKDNDGNKVTIPLGNSDGDGIFSYSIFNYYNAVCGRTGNDLNENLINFVQSILDYGECASYYFDNKGYLPEITTPGTKGIIRDQGYDEYAAKFVGTIPDGVTYVGSSLLLKSETIVRHYFRMENPGNIQVTVKGDPAEIHSKDGLYYIDNKFSYKELGNMEQLVKLSDGNKNLTIKYCPLSYCEKASRTSNDEALVALANSLYWVEYYKNIYFKFY